jgi:hypothetical protein
MKLCVLIVDTGTELTDRYSYGCGLYEGYGTAWGEGRSGMDYYTMSIRGAIGDGKGSGRINIYLKGNGRSYNSDGI